MAGVIASIPKFQFSNALGLPMSGGTLTSYLAGTTTPVTTYQDEALTSANTNPINLDSRGECTLWLDSTKVYKFILKNAAGVTQWTVDNITNSTAFAKAYADALETELRADLVSKAELAASSGSSLAGFLQSGTGAVATTVQSKLRGSVSVKDFGAVGDGSHDDTDAIQSALDSDAKTIFVTDGTYKIRSTLTIGSNKAFVLFDGATITALATDIGNDPATSGDGIFSGNPRGFPMITNSDHSVGNENISITGGNWVFTRNASVRAGAIVDLRKVTNAQIKELKCDCPGDGLYTSSVGTIYALLSYYITVQNCSVDRSVGCHCIYFNETWWSKISDCSGQYTNDSAFVVDEGPFCQVLNCYAFESAGSAISFNSKYGLVQGNTINGSGPTYTIPGVGICINIGHPETEWSADHTKVIGNTIWGHSKSSGILVQQSPPTTNVVISGNTVEGKSGGPPSGNVTYGISTVGTNVTVTGNTVRNCSVGIRVYGDASTISGNITNANYRQGILVVSGKNSITGNVSYDNGQSGTTATALGISFEDAARCKGNTVYGNICYDSGGNVQKVGINFGTNNISNIVSANSCTQHADADIFMATAGNIFAQNILGTIYSTNPVQAFMVLDNTGTPSVRNAGLVVQTGGTTNITTLTGAYRGQIVTILSEHAVTIVDSATMYLNGNVNFVMKALDTLTIVWRGGQWVEIARSVI